MDARCQERIALPARICWLGHGEQDRAGLAFNDLVASGAVSAPIVIGRDHLDCGSVASPYRRPRRWPTARTRSRTGRCSTPDRGVVRGDLVSIHHGGGVGIGRSIHAEQVSVADGTTLAAEQLARVLTNDPGMGSSGMSTRAASGPTRLLAARAVCGSPMREG